jgi:hypothetical protein
LFSRQAAFVQNLKFPSTHENQDDSKSQQQLSDALYRCEPSLALAFDRASLLLFPDLFQTFAGTSIMGGTAAHQWIGNFLVAGQIAKSVPELERIIHEIQNFKLPVWFQVRSVWNFDSRLNRWHWRFVGSASRPRANCREC